MKIGMYQKLKIFCTRVRTGFRNRQFGALKRKANFRKMSPRINTQTKVALGQFSQSLKEFI